MKIIIQIIIVLFCICSNVEAQDSDIIELKKEWFKFAEAVQKHDISTLETFITDTVFCPNCPYNTISEEKEMIKIQNTEAYPYTLYIYLAKIPAYDFITNDLYQICDSNAINRMTVGSLLNFNIPHNYSTGYEVTIVIIDPDHSSNIEGFQYSFGFINKDGKFILDSFSTIP